MKKLQLKVSTLIGRMCAFGLAVLGITSCSGDSEDYPCMYGSPTGTFEIKGTVVTKDGTPVDTASIYVKDVKTASPLTNPYKPIKTDSDGKFLIEYKGFPSEKVRVICVPGDKSGLATDSVDFNLEYKNRDKSDSWDCGSAESTVTIELDAKNDEGGEKK